MNDPNSSGPHPLIDDDEEDYDDRGSSQADDPTAVWDEDALAKLGVDIARRSKTAGKERERDTDPPGPVSKGLSWPIVIGLALVVGGLVFVVVRYVL